MSVKTTNTGNPQDTAQAAPEGHDEKMAAAFDAAQNPGATADAPKVEAPAKPDWLPEKFFKDGKPDYEALAKSYGELEKGKSAPKPEAKIEAPTTSTEEAQAKVAEAGLDYSAISARFQEKGDLASEDRAALNKAGLPDSMIDAYVAGQRALAQSFEATVFEAAGGQEKFSEMAQWAAKGLTAGEIASFNKAMDSGNVDGARLAIAGLQARFEAAIGSDPKLVNGATASATADVFRSTAELMTAMADPRYKSDPAYRGDVVAKLSRSSIM